MQVSHTQEISRSYLCSCGHRNVIGVQMVSRSARLLVRRGHILKLALDHMVKDPQQSIVDTGRRVETLRLTEKLNGVVNGFNGREAAGLGLFAHTKIRLLWWRKADAR